MCCFIWSLFMWSGVGHCRPCFIPEFVVKRSRFLGVAIDVVQAIFEQVEVEVDEGRGMRGCEEKLQ